MSTTFSWREIHFKNPPHSPFNPENPASSHFSSAGDVLRVSIMCYTRCARCKLIFTKSSYLILIVFIIWHGKKLPTPVWRDRITSSLILMSMVIVEKLMFTKSLVILNVKKRLAPAPLPGTLLWGLAEFFVSNHGCEHGFQHCLQGCSC